MSKFFFKDKPIIGLDISSTGIKVMSIDSKRWLVNGYGSLDLDPLKMKESLENPENTFLVDNLKQLSTKFFFLKGYVGLSCTIRSGTYFSFFFK